MFPFCLFIIIIIIMFIIIIITIIITQCNTICINKYVVIATVKI